MITHKPKLNPPTGFTLIELIVVIGILVLIMTATTINYQRSNSRSELIAEADKVVSDIRLAENNAASSKTFNAQEVGSNIWGVYFETLNPQQYKIFVDKGLGAPKVYDGYYTIGQDYIWQTNILPNRLKLNSTDALTIVCDGAPISAAEVSIAFVPPDPTVVIQGIKIGDTLIQKNCSQATITLYDDINNSTKQVTVNFAGLVDVGN